MIDWSSLAGALWLAAVTPATVSPPVPVSCPADATVRGVTPPEGYEQWCERTGGDGGVMRHGPYRAWHSNGQAFISADYCSGNRCGRYAEWYPTGRPKSLGEFDTLGRYQGRWSFWTEAGAIIEQDFTDGQLVRSGGVPVTSPGTTTTTTTVTLNTPPAATAQQASMFSGPPALLAQSGVGGSAWVQERAVPTAAVICPPSAIPAGEPYPQGLVQWCQRRDRYGRWVRHGILREWYPNGRKRSESDYINGRPTGWVTRWYPNGQKAEETHFRFGVPDGKSARWTEDGVLIGEEIFQNGVRTDAFRGPPPRWPLPP